MIINVLIHIEHRIDIECVAEVNFPWDRDIAPKDWKEVRSTDYQVHVNSVPAVKLRLDNPHASIRVGAIKGFAKLVNKRAQKYFVSNLEKTGGPWQYPTRASPVHLTQYSG